MTKPLAGQSFSGFLSDLGMREFREAENNEGRGSTSCSSRPTRSPWRASCLGCWEHAVQMAEAHAEEGERGQESSTFEHLWTCGLVLVVIGAIWVARAACMSVHCCLRRLCLRAGERHQTGDSEEEEGGGSSTSWRSRRPRTTRAPTRTLRSEEGAEKTSTSEEEAAVADAAPGTTRMQSSWRDDTRRGCEVQKEEQLQVSDRSGAKLSKGQPSSPGPSSSSSRPLRRRSVQPSGSTDPPSVLAEKASGAAEKAAESAHRAARAADQAAERAEVASALLQKVATQAGQTTTQLVDLKPANPWNRFQQENAAERMRAEYYRSKTLSHRKMP